MARRRRRKAFDAVTAHSPLVDRYVRRHHLEEIMLKLLSICAALVSFGIGAANAQQQEAVLQTITVPGAAFDIMVAMPKVPGETIDLGESPEALVIRLAGGDLAIAFESGEQMLKALASLRYVVGTVRLPANGSTPPIPVAVYMIPKGEMLASAEK
jgi:hypothetical protein